MGSAWTAASAADGRLGGVVDVDQVEELFGIAGYRLAALQDRPAHHPAWPVESRESQDDRRGRMVVCVGPVQDALLGLEADPARFVLGTGRRRFIDPLAVGLAINAGRAGVNEACHRRWQCYQEHAAARRHRRFAWKRRRHGRTRRNKRRARPLAVGPASRARGRRR